MTVSGGDIGVHQAVIIDAVRTPVGAYGGRLSALRAEDMAVLVLRAR